MKFSCEHLQNRAHGYFAGQISEAEKAAVSAHLTTCQACQAEFAAFEKVWQRLGSLPPQQPSPELAIKFNTMLRGYRQGLLEATAPGFSLRGWLTNAFRRPAFQLGFSLALLMIGFLSGLAWKSVDQSNYAQLAGEMDEMRQLVMMAMLKQESSVDRLQAVNWSYAVEKPNDSIRDALQKTLENDPNTNVRIAALRALRPYAHDSQVRRDIVDTFAQQVSPLVQIEIIDFIRVSELRPIELLELLLQEKNLNEVVAQHIKWTIGTLKGETVFKEKRNENVHF